MTQVLDQVAAEVRVCPRCRLAESRTHAVPGEGDPSARLMLVGEAPGAAEDQTGRPFQGMAGRFLNRELEAIGLTRDQVFVTSVNKCRPPGNRPPKPDEVAACSGYLDHQLAVLVPAVVLAMGGTAAGRLHPDRDPDRPHRPLAIGELRGAPIPFGPEQALIVTYHPAAAMRFPARRQPFIDDLTEAAHLAGLA